MTGIILAAGLGSRLGKDKPKGLLLLPNGETILGRQVRLMKEAGIDRIIIIVGFKHDLIEAEISDVEYRLNERYRETNTAKSLLIGLDGLDENVLWMNGDVIFDEGIVCLISERPENTVLVNKARCGEEEVKYIADQSGIITEISKQVKNAHGEALGINLVTREAVDSFRLALEQVSDNDYFEHAIQAMISNGTRFRELDLGERKCIEIDFEQDWLAANDMFRGMK